MRRADRSCRPREWNCRRPCTHRRYRHGDNHWGRRSTYRQRLDFYGRTNTATYHQIRYASHNPSWMTGWTALHVVITRDYHKTAVVGCRFPVVGKIGFWRQAETGNRQPVFADNRQPTTDNAGRARLNVLFNDLINDPIFLGMFGDHDVIPLHVLLDLLDRPAGVAYQDIVGDLPHPQDLPRLNVDV